MGKDLTQVTRIFQFCDGGSCRKANGEQAIREARAYLRNNGLWDSTHTIKTRCNGRCEDAPTWIVQPGNYWYKEINPEKAVAIVHAHVKDTLPAEEFLLYKNTWDHVRSDREKNTPPIVFKRKDDMDYGWCYVARAWASDQYLYPFFKYVFENANPFKVDYLNQEHIITKSHRVIYTDTFDICITGEELRLTLAIGSITKVMEPTIAPEIMARKVSSAEVLWLQQPAAYTKALRLKNRRGKHLATLWFDDNDTQTWHYILKIYLNMEPENPRIDA